MSYQNHGCIRTNKVIDVQKERVGTGLESYPITLAQAKAWLKMTDIDDDDDIIQRLIEEGTDWLEELCGISITETAVTSYLQVHNRVELPYGPVMAITAVNDIPYDPAVNNCVYPTTGFANLSGHGTYKVEYDAGYTSPPTALIGALYGYIAYAYENRGDDFDMSSDKFASVALNKALPFTRNYAF